MPDRKTTLNDHSALSNRLLRNLEDFIDAVGDRNSTAHFESVTTDEKYLKGKALGQKPERFVEEHLIFPVIKSLGHSFQRQPVQYAPRWSHGRGIPDFSLTTIPVNTAKDSNLRLFGESKTPNKLEYARNDVQEYLKKDLDFHALALLSDGIEWELWIRPRNQPLGDECTPHMQASLRDALGAVKARNLENESYHSHDVRVAIDDAFSGFTAAAVTDLLLDEFGLDLP